MTDHSLKKKQHYDEYSPHVTDISRDSMSVSAERAALNNFATRQFCTASVRLSSLAIVLTRPSLAD
jgi:hypothetical protein